VLDAAVDWEELLRRLASQLDEPLFEPVYVVLHLLCAEAQRQGVRVVLTGDGADELFYGYSARYHMPARAEKYRRFPFARQLADVTARVAPTSRVGRQAAGVRRLLSARTVAQRYLAYSAVFEAEDRIRLLGHRVDGFDRLPELVVTRAMGDSARLGFTQALAATDLRLWVGEHFNPRLDRISMMHSVEARVPFQDDELIDAFLGRDPRLNLEPGAGKALLRRAFADRLPAKIVRRRKRAFQAPGATLVRHGMRPMVSELLSGGHVRQFGVLEPTATETIAQRAMQGGEARSFELWSLIALQLWCEAYLGGEATARAA
jgi:asparagine synthase (glutamine-hydrolysing)